MKRQVAFCLLVAEAVVLALAFRYKLQRGISMGAVFALLNVSVAFAFQCALFYWIYLFRRKDRAS